MSHTTIKEKVTEVKGTQKKIFYKITLHSLSQESSSFTDLNIGSSLADATPAYYSSTQFIL